ncbi:hypothetical protein Rxycam_01329 [Rubrobacter xylanophilus DSM 9941]|uniref:NfeD-like C-terminal domain-containing protein n=1 Tax=Rubrobacter xylanophilus TaxID=49319 RepID=A0A510HIQ7_9ACTN|nr:NfeD family protein [Rubrobacter xylanophilus]QYJ15505.1 hypothetical protein Rxycam_01329 [Rubrobacter xylanophilus DSM 9941]BBL79872.1 hypothetical protein RxyAA322_17260 [Rubrobacter xylanophilus]
MIPVAAPLQLPSDLTLYVAGLAVLLLLLAAGGAAAYAAFRASGGRPATGLEGMIGERGVVRRRVDGSPDGAVFVRGELWRAVPEESASPLEEGTPVEVVAFRGMTLVVRPVREEGGLSPP